MSLERNDFINKIIHGDCLNIMKEMPENSIDAIVTDPPYGLSFMNKDWDKLNKHISPLPEGKYPKNKNLKEMRQGGSDGYLIQLWHAQWLKEAYQILKPGGSMLIMGGTRTFHRLMCAIEDTGFIIKDTLMWLYGGGFPKAQDLTNMLKKRGIETNKWQGFKIGGIKPAFEPIVWAVRPPKGSYIDNVLKWEVGAVNVDKCRIVTNDKLVRPNISRGKNEAIFPLGAGIQNEPKGRFPANIILDEEAGRLLDEQSGILKSGDLTGQPRVENKNVYGKAGATIGNPRYWQGDSGGASRFFYCAKASKSERGKNNKHPTVKPIKLFKWLIKLVTREGQVVLDPFIGSGTTAIAAYRVGRKYIGIEREKEYIKIAEERLAQGVLWSEMA
ncbi:MAG: DNA-methyltransferase [Candidatus Hodarchaeales archaeon]